jgi:subtilisin-like proprotein convertase family protein
MTDRRFNSKRYVRVAGFSLALAALGILMAKNMAGDWLAAHAGSSATTQASRFAGQDKESLVVRLNELDAQIRDLKTQLSTNRKNKQLLAQLNAAQAESAEISAYMGGDKAAPTGDPADGEASLRQAIRDLRKRIAADPADQQLRTQLRVLTARLNNDGRLRGGEITPQGGPGAPPGCTAATTSVTQSTPTAIPTGPAVVTSTVVVAGAGPFLHDVNLTTVMPHTFAADLDVTLMSPSGTVVTLTTDNGAGNDNVFNGTVWDDFANPAGQVPYVTNNGLVTDHAYVNNVLASPLVPEESMSAFRGEDPNGTWTITISDDLAGDGGSLDSWTLDLVTLTTAPTDTTASFTNNTPVAIPTGPAVVTSTLVVSGAGTSLTNLTLSTTMPHTFAADLDVTLSSPAGTVVTLTTDNGAGNDNVFNGTLWDDDANPAGQVPYVTNNGLVTDHAFVNNVLASPLVVEEAMGAFIGEDPNGTWTITISDDLAGDGGSLDTWTLNVTTGTCAAACVLTCPANITQSNDPNQCGAVVNYPPPMTSGTCTTVTCTPPSGSFFPVGTTTVTCTDTGGATCSFTITVNDTQPPTITCPNDVTAVGGTGGTTVTFSDPVATDNCPGVTTACVPPSGSIFPMGSTTVTCTATDASGNTATCSFNVAVFDTCLQDSSDPTKVLLIDSTTGAYQICCGGMTLSGTGTVTKKGLTVTLQHNAPDRRVLGKSTGGGKGSGSLQFPPGTTVCTIIDNTAGNGTCACSAAPPPVAPVLR